MIEQKYLQLSKDNKGKVFWITGLSGSGKTTIAQQLYTRMKHHNIPVILLDGDVLRQIFQQENLHDIPARKKLAMSYSRLCSEISNQGINVICSTISMFNSVRQWNRDNISLYNEIYLKVPINELERRDSKEIYRKAREGMIENVVGIDIPFEEPLSPDIILQNYGKSTPEQGADIIWNKIFNHTQ